METTRHRRDARTWVAALTVPVSILLSALLVVIASFSAFTARTETPSNTFGAGTVELWNDHTTQAVFSEASLSPGDTAWAMARVEYRGTVPADVRLYARVDGGTQQLAEHVQLSLRIPGVGSPWTGTLAEFQQITGFAGGILPISMAQGDQAYVVFEYRVLETAPQASGASVVFVWEAQST